MKFTNYLLLERNIVNTDIIDKYIYFLIYNWVDGRHLAESAKIKKWINSNLKNYMLREHEDITPFNNMSTLGIDSYRAKEPWIQKAIDRGDKLYFLTISIVFRNKIIHVLDYFEANPDLNISRISIPEAIRQSERWTEELNKKALDNEDPSGLKEVRKYPDGFRWVKVTSAQSLDREGKLMKHCVGSYYDRVSSGSSIIYSLRDKKNEPHCTVEVQDTELIQAQGKANGPIDDKYLKYVQDFVMKPVFKLKYADPDVLSGLGLFLLKGKFIKTHNISDSDRKLLIDALMRAIFYDTTPASKSWATSVLEELDLDFEFGETNVAGNIIYGTKKISLEVKDKIRKLLEKKMTIDLVEFYSNYIH